jgi:hypothetical protein
MGLGSAGKGEVSLADARQKAQEARHLLNSGVDPINHRRNAEKIQRTVPTFGEMADAYVTDHAPTFHNTKHLAQWKMTLGDNYCKAIRQKAVSEITTEDVLAVLRPIWDTVPETDQPPPSGPV